MERQQYCGPGSLTLSANKEVNEACRKHDSGYDKLGSRAYFQHNEVDEEFLETLQSLPRKGFVGGLAQAFFTAKKYLTPKMPGTNVIIMEDKTGDDYTSAVKSYRQNYHTKKVSALSSNSPSYRRKSRYMKKMYKPMQILMRKRWGRNIYNLPSRVHYGMRFPTQRAIRYKKVVRAQKINMPSYLRLKRKYRNKRKSYFYKKMAKIAKSVVNKTTGNTRFWHGQDTGQVSNGLVASATVSAANRSITFAKYTLGNATEQNDMLTDTGLTVTVNDRLLISDYEERWTFVNSHAFPCYITVYEFVLKQDQYPRSGLSGDYLTAAAERALYQTSLPDDNHIATYPASGFPIELLWKYNLYRGMNLDSSLSDTFRSHVDGTSFGSGDKLTVMNRHYLHTKFKINGLKKDMVLRKRGVYLIDAGQTSVHTFKRKKFYVPAYKQADGGSMHMKGGGGLIFHMTGTLVHESDDTYNDVGRSPIQLDWELRRYCRLDLFPQSDADAYRHYSDRNYTVLTTAEQMAEDAPADVTKG